MLCSNGSLSGEYRQKNKTDATATVKRTKQTRNI